MQTANEPRVSSCAGAAAGSRVAQSRHDMSNIQTKTDWRAADPRFTTPQHMAERARVQAKLGRHHQDWAVDPRFA